MSTLRFTDDWGTPVLFLSILEKVNQLARYRAQLEDEESFELYLRALPAVRELRKRMQDLCEFIRLAAPHERQLLSDSIRLTERLNRLHTHLVKVPNALPETLRNLRDDHIAGCCYRLEYFEEQLFTLAQSCLDEFCN